MHLIWFGMFFAFCHVGACILGCKYLGLYFHEYSSNPQKKLKIISMPKSLSVSEWVINWPLTPMSACLIKKWISIDSGHRLGLLKHLLARAIDCRDDKLWQRLDRLSGLFLLCLLRHCEGIWRRESPSLLVYSMVCYMEEAGHYLRYYWLVELSFGTWKLMAMTSWTHTHVSFKIMSVNLLSLKHASISFGLQFVKLCKSKFLLRWRWLWVGDNLCLLWDYLCLLYS